MHAAILWYREFPPPPAARGLGRPHRWLCEHLEMVYIGCSGVLSAFHSPDTVTGLF